MAGHGFDDGPEGHGAALGVGGLALTVGFGGGGDEFEVPVAGGVKEHHGRGEVVGCVTVGPDALVKWLDLGLIFAEGLAEAEAEDDLAVGEVRDDLSDAPLSGRGRVLKLCFGERGEELMQGAGGGIQNWQGLSAIEEFSVRIEFHEETVSRLKRD